MFLNNINYKEKLIQFMQLYEEKLDTLILQQFLEDKEFNISDKHKDIQYLLTAFEYVDSLFKDSSKYIDWQLLKTNANLNIIRQKLAYAGYDLDDILNLYIDTTDEINLQLGIGDNPIIESIPIIFIPYQAIPSHPKLMRDFRFGISEQGSIITDLEFTNSNSITITDLYNNINIQLLNISNKCPFVAIEINNNIISIIDDNEETIQDYISIVKSFNGKIYNCKKLDGITTIDDFNRIIKFA